LILVFEIYLFFVTCDLEILNDMINKNISIIVAIAENFAIGKNNELLFHLPTDLKRFKEITTGHSLIMGETRCFRCPNGRFPIDGTL
jgi:hypothetical protein